MFQDPNNPYTNMNDPFIMKALASSGQLGMLPNAEMLVDPSYAVFQNPARTDTIRDIIARSRAANLGMVGGFFNNAMQNPNSMMGGVAQAFMGYDPSQYTAVNNYWAQQQHAQNMMQMGGWGAGMVAGGMLGNAALRTIGLGNLGGVAGWGARAVAGGIGTMGVGLAAGALWDSTIGKQINEADTIRSTIGSHLTLAGANDVGTGVNFNTAREMNRAIYKMRDANPYMSLGDTTRSFISGANLDLFNQGSADLGTIAQKAKKVMEVTQNVLTFAGDLQVDDIMKSLNKLQKMGLKVDDAQKYFEESNRISMQTGLSGNYLRNQIGQAGAAMYQGMGLNAGTGAIEAMRAYGEADLMNKMGIVSTRDLSMLGGISGAAQQQAQFTGALGKKGMTQARMAAAMSVGSDGKIHFDAAKYKKLSSTMDYQEMINLGNKNMASWTADQTANAINIMDQSAEEAQRNDPNYLRSEISAYVKNVRKQMPGASLDTMLRVLKGVYPEVSENEIRTVLNSIMGPNAQHYEAARLGDLARNQYNTQKGILLRKSQKGTLLQRAGRSISDTMADLSNWVLDSATQGAAKGYFGQAGKDLLVGTTGVQEQLEAVNAMSASDINRVMSNTGTGGTAYSTMGLANVNTNVSGQERVDMVHDLAAMGINKGNIKDKLKYIQNVMSDVSSGGSYDSYLSNVNVKPLMDKRLNGRSIKDLSDSEKKQMAIQAAFFSNLPKDAKDKLLAQMDKNPNVLGDMIAKTISVGATSSDADTATATAELQQDIFSTLNPQQDASKLTVASGDAADILKGLGADTSAEKIKNLVTQGKGGGVTGLYSSIKKGDIKGLSEALKTLGNDRAAADVLKKGSMEDAFELLQEGGYHGVVEDLLGNAKLSDIQNMKDTDVDKLMSINLSQDDALKAKVYDEVSQLKDEDFNKGYDSKQLAADLKAGGAGGKGADAAKARIAAWAASGKGASLLGDSSQYKGSSSDIYTQVARQFLQNTQDEQGKYGYTNVNVAGTDSDKNGISSPEAAALNKLVGAMENGALKVIDVSKRGGGGGNY